MKRNRIMVMVLALVMALALSIPAFAAEGDPCDYKCKNTVTGHIQMGAEEGYQNNGEDCGIFDYESGEGYCGDHRTLDIYDYDCDEGDTRRGNRLFFKVCDCPDPSQFVVDDTRQYQIKVTILTEGVYWSSQNHSMLCSDDLMYVQSWEDIDDACTCDATGTNGHSLEVRYYLDADGVEADPLDTCGIIPDCEVPDDNRPVTVVTDSYGGSTFFANNNPLLEIDIPSFVYDLSEVSRGDVVRVKVAILDSTSQGPCTECKELCSCTVTIGTFGCPSETDSDCKLVFPYATAPDLADWWTGISLANNTSSAGSVNITFTDADGGSGTTSVDLPANGMYVGMVADLVANLDAGSTLDTSKPLTFSATPTFCGGITGFCMIVDGTNGVGMGYLPIDCCCKGYLCGGKSCDGK